MYSQDTIPYLFFPGIDTAAKAYKASCYYTRSATKRLQDLTRTSQTRDLSYFLGLCALARYTKDIQAALPDDMGELGMSLFVMGCMLYKYQEIKQREADYKKYLISEIICYDIAIKDNQIAYCESRINILIEASRKETDTTMKEQYKKNIKKMESEKKDASTQYTESELSKCSIKKLEQIKEKLSSEYESNHSEIKHSVSEAEDIIADALEKERQREMALHQKKTGEIKVSLTR